MELPVPVDFLQSLALVLIPAVLASAITTAGTVFVAVRVGKLSAAQANLSTQQAEMHAEQKATNENINGKMTKLLEVNKIASHASGVIEGSGIKSDLAAVVSEAATAAVKATNGDR
jgi:hypothetical protein